MSPRCTKEAKVSRICSTRIARVHTGTAISGSCLGAGGGVRLGQTSRGIGADERLKRGLSEQLYWADDLKRAGQDGKPSDARMTSHGPTDVRSTPQEAGRMSQ